MIKNIYFIITFLGLSTTYQAYGMSNAFKAKFGTLKHEFQKLQQEFNEKCKTSKKPFSEIKAEILASHYTVSQLKTFLEKWRSFFDFQHSDITILDGVMSSNYDESHGAVLKKMKLIGLFHKKRSYYLDYCISLLESNTPQEDITPLFEAFVGQDLSKDPSFKKFMCIMARQEAIVAMKIRLRDALANTPSHNDNQISYYVSMWNTLETAHDFIDYLIEDIENEDVENPISAGVFDAIFEHISCFN